jgi:hypothetical protein
VSDAARERTAVEHHRSGTGIVKARDTVVATVAAADPCLVEGCFRECGVDRCDLKRQPYDSDRLSC